MGVNMTQTATDPRSSQNGWAISTPLDRPIRGIARRVGGTKAKEVERFLKFAIVGIIGAIVDFGTLNLLLHTILPAVDNQGNPLGITLPGGFLFENVGIATTIAFVAAVASNFIWNRIWTYPDARGRSLRRQLGLFAFISLVGWLARLVWIKTSYSLFADLLMSNNASMLHDQAAIVGTNIAQLIAVGVVMIWNFVANRLWTYNDVQ
jgi:putative flippase GtrA